jgi:ribosome-associated protein
MKPDKDPEIDVYLKAVQGKKASDIVALDVREITTMADVFIILSGRSSRQVMAIADHIQSELKGKGIKPLSVEGRQTGHWILMDYGHVLIHIFYESTRDFYDLESLWADGRRMVVEPVPEDGQGFDEAAALDPEDDF